MKKNILFIFLIVFHCNIVIGQQESVYTQYMYNTQHFNPAVVGLKNVWSIYALHRNQWIGLEGAPVTNNLAIQSPMSKNNLAYGLSFYTDKIGPSDESNISLDFSYTIKTSINYNLAFGLKTSVNLLNVDFNKLSIYEMQDNLIRYNIDNKFSPNIGLGVYYYSKNNFFGISIPSLLETKFFDKGQSTYSSNSVASKKKNWYAMAGKNISINNKFEMKPVFLLKIVDGVSPQLDFSTNFIYNEKFIIGVNYRLNAALSMSTGFQISDSWFIGYTYDSDITNLAKYNSGSHELFLKYDLFKK